MRIDRMLTLSVIAPLHEFFSTDTPAVIPILMYHSIAADIDDATHPYFRTVTSPQTFSQQVDLLRAQGFDAITLSQAIGLLRSAGAKPPQLSRKVVITFDDGFRDFHTYAFPVLERAGFCATVFLASAFIGKTFITGRQCLSAAEVRSLCDRGVEFGSHSVSHRRLVDLSPDDLAEELATSKSSIEDVTGREVTLFSYPFRFPEEDSHFTAKLGRLLDECGYRGGVTTSIGRSTVQDDPRFLPRLPINDCDDTPLLRAKLAGHYDWLRSAQRLRKRSRALWQKWAGA